jgi:hypothetical protein
MDLDAPFDTDLDPPDFRLLMLDLAFPSDPFAGRR